MTYQDYFDGDQLAENAAYELNAPYDYVREANAGMDDPVAGTEVYTEQDYIDAWKAEGWTDAEIADGLKAIR